MSYGVNRSTLTLLWICVHVVVIPTAVRGQTMPIQIQTIALRGVTPTSFQANKDLRIYVDPASLSSVHAFQVRVFAGTKSTLPHLGQLTPDGCLQYNTMVYPSPYYRQGEVYVTSTNRSWLSAPDRQHYVNGHFVLVFEVGAPRDLRIKIAMHDVEHYFSYGIEIEVTPDEYLPENVAQEVQNHINEYNAIVSTSAARGCLTVVKTKASAIFLNFASCNRPSTAPDIDPQG